MISVTDLRSGTTFSEGRDIFQVMSYEHIKMGRGSANIKIKARNLRSGAITEKSYISGANVQDIYLANREYQFLYKRDNTAYFMDMTTYEQIEVPLKSLFGHEYLQEGESVQVQFYDEEILGLVLPPKITMKVADTAPGVKGNSASNVYKDAELENGIKIRVPLFINNGDSVVVDTRDGSYTKRA